MKFCHSIALSILCLYANPALAQKVDGTTGKAANASDLTGFIAVGPGAIPKFEGSDDYQIIPFAIADVQWKGVGLQIRGLGARANIAGLLGDDHFQAGPAINFRPKRGHQDGGALVSRLDDVDAAVEVGGFVGYRFGGDRNGRGAISTDLELVADVNGSHGGWLATGQISYAAVRTKAFFLNADVSATYGSKNYTRTYFGVTAPQSVQSGRVPYTPDAGIRDIGAGLTAGYQFDRHWGVVARAGASVFVGDVKNSPIVAEGSKTQAIMGLALSYRF